jgi:hypothetical protein
MRHRFTAGLLTVTLGAGLVAFGAPTAHASSKGRRNTAIGLGALAAYGLLRGKTGTGLAAGAGAAYAYKRYRDARKNERRSNRYYRGYGSSYRTNSAGSSYYVPAGYQGSRNRYRNSSSRYQSRAYEPSYTRGDSRPYVTDEWGNRRYYDPRKGDGFTRYDGRRYGRRGFVSRYQVDTQAAQYGRVSDDYCPPGKSRGYRNGRRYR